MTQATESVLTECIKDAESRLDIWRRFLNATRVKRLIEVGVFRGDFAAQILGACDSIETYYMLDPWRHLDDWDKPANDKRIDLTTFMDETLRKTEFAATKRVVLRGKTSEVIGQVPDGALDFAYIDGDHTLKGITIDLTRLYPKVKAGGWIGGDDFCPFIWQHPTTFEPTLVFPYAVYFAEAVGARIYALPYAQFLLEKGEGEFAFIDLTGDYSGRTLKRQLSADTLLRLKLREAIRPLRRAVRLLTRPRSDRRGVGKR